MLETVENELAGVKLAAANSPAFKSFLENPLISRDKKEKRVKEMFEGKVSIVTLNLMMVLAGNARLADAPKISDTYSQLMKAKRGEVAMKVQVGKDKKVILSTEVDPSILGGLQVQIGDQFLDLSVGNKIDAISRTAM